MKYVQTLMGLHPPHWCPQDTVLHPVHLCPALHCTTLHWCSAPPYWCPAPSAVCEECSAGQGDGTHHCHCGPRHVTTLHYTTLHYNTLLDYTSQNYTSLDYTTLHIIVCPGMSRTHTGGHSLHRRETSFLSHKTMLRTFKSKRIFSSHLRTN